MSRRRRRRNPSTAGSIAVASLPLVPYLALGLGAWWLYSKVRSGIGAAAEEAAKAYANWDGDPNHPIYPTTWATPEWAKATGAADAYAAAQAAGAGNQVSASPVAGPYMPGGIKE